MLTSVHITRLVSIRASCSGHVVTLAKDQCRLDIRKYSFSLRTINEWNRLSTDCVNMFKNKIDKYLRRAAYTYMKHVWIPGMPVASMCTCHLGLLVCMATLLNLVKSG